MAERFLRIGEVCERYGVSEGWVYMQIKAGRFVEPVRLGANAVRWPESKLIEFDKTLPTNVTGRGGPGRGRRGKLKPAS
jgi:predicted DNA-binding transcriptional regulator AlpA